MLLRSVFFVFLTLCALSGSARAQDYAGPSWANLVKTMVRFNALNLSDPALVDEYTIITECELYKAFHQNDFKWNEVRQAVLQSVRQNIATFPMNYRYDAELQLERYDFNSNLFKFTPKTVLHNVNTFVLYSVEGTGCGAADIKIMPRTFRAVVAAPVYLEGLPLAEKDAKALLERMDKAQNTDRIIYARFNLRIVFIEPLRKSIIESGADDGIHYSQSNMPAFGVVRLDVRLDSIDFFEDPQRTKLAYQYIP